MDIAQSAIFMTIQGLGSRHAREAGPGRFRRLRRLVPC
jgi:hypothetical protein